MRHPPNNQPIRQKTPDEEVAEKVFNVGCLSVIVLIAVVLIFSSIQSALETPEQKAAKQTQELNRWFGSASHIDCEYHLKEQLRDPNSYQKGGNFITPPSKDGKTRLITWKFRSKNGFGGYTAATAMCLISKEDGGKVVASVISD